MASPKEAAERYETLAKEYEKRARGLEGLRKKPTRYGQSINYNERMEELHRKASMLYEKAAEEWKKTGKINQAVEDYRNSEEYAWRPGDKDRLAGIIEQLKPKKSGSFFSILAITFLLSSLFFISFSLTGNAIADLSKDNLTLIGAGLFILGLVFAFFYVQEKKR